MAFTKDELVALYQKSARDYDVSGNRCYLIGFRERYCRRLAVAALQLKAGDAVVGG